MSETDVYSDAPAEQPGEFDYQILDANGPTHDRRASHRPRLTAEERAYLDQNHGCYRCRALNADHMSSNCPRYAPAPGAPATSSTPLSTAPAARTRPGMVAAIQTFQETVSRTAEPHW
ncbi:BZ3500_MvSof-1268-A1-R1_Chr10-1g02693 [Microbotryum saponariae]|uniref:BZ3500_MvSof-1268-A1-R1_Chr10-1g02693 protein n=1 Tax=Microbotryum saponariae TaxID=289078 RepID=A0A2X0NEZ9_9BASI|nr:BZ3500_MvSof-1268-A1-R1_Chr10-1g02693 [Microbotryum saponariae]SDA06182.1 BZ3501_MvSof-1269-A2-R1_Chr10-1g02294 [Microbotryum saponariae]